jgi:hypothetical protein
MDEGRWAIRFWRWLPLLYLGNAGFLLIFFSFPGNLVPALVFLVLGLGHFGAGKFVGGAMAPLQISILWRSC